MTRGLLRTYENSVNVLLTAVFAGSKTLHHHFYLRFNSLHSFYSFFNPSEKFRPSWSRSCRTDPDRPCYLAAVGVLHPLAQTGFQAGRRNHRHQAAVVVLGGRSPGDGSGAGVQQSDADGLRTLPQLLQEFTPRTWSKKRWSHIQHEHHEVKRLNFSVKGETNGLRRLSEVTSGDSGRSHSSQLTYR